MLRKETVGVIGGHLIRVLTDLEKDSLTSNREEGKERLRVRLGWIV
jgi:hypothetical protein